MELRGRRGRGEGNPITCSFLCEEFDMEGPFTERKHPNHFLQNPTRLSARIYVAEKGNMTNMILCLKVLPLSSKMRKPASSRVYLDL